MSPPHRYLYVVVIRHSPTEFEIIDSIDEMQVINDPGSWERMKADKLKYYGGPSGENIRFAKLKTNLGWMKALFRQTTVTAEVIDKVEDREEVTGCPTCPLKSSFMSEWHCTHPGVADRFESDPKSTRLPTGGEGSPDWCPLHATPVLVKRADRV